MNDGLARLKPTTRFKLRQVTFRLMREAGIIDSSHRVRTAFLSPRLKALVAIERPCDLLLFLAENQTKAAND